MTHLRVVSMALVVGLLSGCATTKPEMPSEGYTRNARTFLAVDFCSWKGWISPDMAAAGKRFINANLSGFQVDNTRFNENVSWLHKNAEKPSQGECNQLAAEIAQRQQNIAANNQAVEYNQRETQQILDNSRIKNTYCNRIGTQTLCTSY